MTLPTSGPIDLTHIGYEAKKTLMSQVDINIADFYGATYGVGVGYGATSFIANYNAALSTNTYSNLVYVYNLSETPVSMVIASSFTAYFRINGGAWQSQSNIGSIKDGDTLELYVTTGAVWNIDCSVTATFSGGTTKVWACWTLQGTGTSDFTAVNTAAPNKSYTSNAVKVTGIGLTEVTASVSLATLKVNGVTTNQVKDNDILVLTATSSASYGTAVTPSVVAGPVTKNWSITTGVQNTYYLWVGIEARYASSRTTVYAQYAGTSAPSTKPSWSNAGSWSNPVFSPPSASNKYVCGWYNGVGFIGSPTIVDLGNTSTEGSWLALLKVNCVEANPFSSLISVKSTYCTQNWQVQPTSNGITLSYGSINGIRYTGGLQIYNWSAGGGIEFSAPA